MALVSKLTRRVEIPHEPGQWMELRRLSWRQLEAASDLASDAALKRMSQMGSDMLAAIRSTSGQQAADPAAAYDRAAILQAGIAAWSYDAEVTPENIDALDEETAAWAVREILAMNGRTEEDRKNGS